MSYNIIGPPVATLPYEPPPIRQQFPWSLHRLNGPGVYMGDTTKDDCKEGFQHHVAGKAKYPMKAFRIYHSSVAIRRADSRIELEINLAKGMIQENITPDSKLMLKYLGA